MEKSDLPSTTGPDLSGRHYEAQQALTRSLTSSHYWSERARALPIPLSAAFAAIAGVGTFAATKNPEFSGLAAGTTFLGSLPLTYVAAKAMAWIHDVKAATSRHVLERINLQMELNAAQNVKRAVPPTQTPPHRPTTAAERTAARVQARHERRADPEPVRTPERDTSSDMLAQNMVLAAVVATAVQNETPTPATACEPQTTDSGSASYGGYSDHSTSTYSSPSDTGGYSGGGFDGGGVCAPQML